MEVSFAPNNPSGGVCSMVMWQNKALQDAIRMAFQKSPREQIIKIDVTREGIRAYFEPRNTGA